MRSLALRFVGTAGVAVVVTAALAWVSRGGPLYPADPGPPEVVFREPDDPVEGVLSRAAGRIYSDSPRDYTREASERGLRELDETINTRPDDPRLHWFRHLTLERMERAVEDRAAREEAIRLARAVPGGADLLGEYCGDHSVACAKEGDPAASAAALLTLLDEGPGCVGLYKSVSIWLGENKRGDPKAPGPGPLFPGRERFEASWGPLVRFFESHDGPADATALARVPERVQVGMDYREVLRAVGFPGFPMGRCHWDQGFPVIDDCYEYSLDKPKVVREGHLIGAIPPADPTIVHVVIVGGRVAKATTTRGRPPESDEKTRRHGERTSFEYERNIIAGVAFSPDGSLVAAGGIRGFVSVREVGGGRERSKLFVPGARDVDSPGFLRALAFSPDGKLLAAGGTYDASAHVWEVATGSYRGALNSYRVPEGKGRMDCIAALAFSPDGKTMATVGYDRDLRLWDVATGRLHALLRGHQFEATAVAFAPDGRTIATGDDSGTIRLWDVATLRPRVRWPAYGKRVEGLVYSPDGKTLAVSRGYADVRLRDLASDRWRVSLHQAIAHGSPGMAFAPNGRTLAVSSMWVVATLWDTATGRLIGVLEGHTQFPAAIAYAPDGRTIATGSTDGTLKLWDVPASARPQP